MTVLKVTIEKEEYLELLKKMLREVSFVKNVEEEVTVQKPSKSQVNEPDTPYQQIKNIQDEIKDKELFKEIEDPSEWQRKIRKEWDRDI